MIARAWAEPNISFYLQERRHSAETRHRPERSPRTWDGVRHVSSFNTCAVQSVSSFDIRPARDVLLTSDIRSSRDVSSPDIRPVQDVFASDIRPLQDVFNPDICSVQDVFAPHIRPVRDVIF